MPKGAVLGQPRKLCSGRGAKGFVYSEPIDEICPCHAGTP
jgi:hypothetical protein